jgi:hypothetical protein
VESKIEAKHRPFAWRIATRPDITGKSRRETHCNQERKHRMISFQVFAGLTGYHSEPEYLKS